MKNNKKIKLGKLNFYIIDDNYISYLSQFDKQKIMDKAEKLYNIVTKNSKSQMARFYKELSCNFKLLEEKSNDYNVYK